MLSATSCFVSSQDARVAFAMTTTTSFLTPRGAKALLIIASSYRQLLTEQKAITAICQRRLQCNAVPTACSQVNMGFVSQRAICNLDNKRNGVNQRQSHAGQEFSNAVSIGFVIWMHCDCCSCFMNLSTDLGRSTVLASIPCGCSHLQTCLICPWFCSKGHGFSGTCCLW